MEPRARLSLRIPKARWKGVSDSLIERQKDFKGDAKWTVCALIAHQLRNHLTFGDNLEMRFVEYCERWKISKSVPAVDTFEEIAFEMIDRAFRLLHVVAKSLLGKKLPKSKEPYSQYDNLFKGPTYDYIRQQVGRGAKINYQKKLRRSMTKLVEFLQQD